MRERPILFSAPMVRAILSGNKSQTRRVVKPQPSELECRLGVTGFNPDFVAFSRADDMWVAYDRRFKCDEGNVGEWRSPYGQPGDRLWVKETFFPAHLHRAEPKFAAVVPDYIYAADYQDRLDVVRPHHWRPSIFCGRKASRITLEVVAVRVERLQAISDADAVAEGVETLSGLPTVNAAREYATLWESINGLGSWAANPCVWVVEFRRVL